jgi:hypothetical protein
MTNGWSKHHESFLFWQKRLFMPVNIFVDKIQGIFILDA